MTVASGPFVVTANWILPIAAPPIPNGWIAICDGVVQYVGSQLPAVYASAKRYTLNGYALLPGLINAHCHLEFSDLEAPIPAGNGFPDWIERLLAYRRSQASQPEQRFLQRQAAISSGVHESYAAGVRWIIDITTQPWEASWIATAVAEIRSRSAISLGPYAPVAVQPCIEILDIIPSRLVETLAFANEQIDAPKSDGVWERGVAPHAPYTTSLSTTQQSVQLSRDHQRLSTMHLAESVDEMEWLEKGSGRFHRLLSPIMSDDYFEKRGQISEHLKALESAPLSLIAHGNYLREGELRQLASRSQSMAIVHCPRTHAHFGHQHLESQHYPLEQRQKMGVRHLLGTDSRASNPDLNLWREAKTLRALHSSISSESILRMITSDAADFLGIAPQYGTIRYGSLGLLTAVRLSSVNQPVPLGHDLDAAYDRVLDSDTQSVPLEVVLTGQFGSISQ